MRVGRTLKKDTIMTKITGARILEHIQDSRWRHHPSRALTHQTWPDWANSPEGLIEILRNPALAREPDWELRETAPVRWTQQLLNDSKWESI